MAESCNRNCEKHTRNRQSRIRSEILSLISEYLTFPFGEQYQPNGQEMMCHMSILKSSIDDYFESQKCLISYADAQKGRTTKALEHLRNKPSDS